MKKALIVPDELHQQLTEAGVVICTNNEYVGKDKVKKDKKGAEVNCIDYSYKTKYPELTEVDIAEDTEEPIAE